MKELANIEFYNTPEGEVMMHDEEGVRVFTDKEREVIMKVIFRLTEFYPEALKGLSEWFEKSRYNRRFFEFLIVKQFLKCNFGNFDSVLDVDQFGIFHFEEVACPLRGACKYEGVVCKPKFNTRLSERELEVMRFYVMARVWIRWLIVFFYHRQPLPRIKETPCNGWTYTLYQSS